MTEEQWLSCTDPIRMVEFLRGNPTSEDTVTWWNSRRQFEEASQGNDRQFRLFACACCRRIWDRIPAACNRDAVAAVEDYLDGRLSGQALERAFVASSAVEYREDGSRRSEPGYWIVKDLGRGFYKMTAAASALLIASQVICMADEEYGREAGHVFNSCFYAAAGVFLSRFHWPLPLPTAVEAECAAQAALLRCLFGNPVRSVTIEPRWRTANVVDLAHAIYQGNEFSPSQMAVLADALLDAGAAGELAEHCRNDGPHIKGCWVVDLILGKA